MPNRLFSTALAILVLMTAGCSFIPAYEPPELPVEKAWSQGAGQSREAGAGQPVETGAATAGTPAADLAWQDYFQSDTLQQLIQLTLDNNRDLRVAVLTIEQARAAYRIQEANTLPVVSGNAGLSRQGVAQDNSATGRAYTSDTTMSASLGVTAYELDFFGRVKNMNQSALETFLATEAAALSTRIALIGQTADAYLSLLADRKLLGLAKDTCQAQKETYDVIQNQFEVGSATQLDLSQAATAVESARVSIARYTRQLAQAENALTLLAGISVKALLNSKETIDKIRFLDNLPAGGGDDGIANPLVLVRGILTEVTQLLQPVDQPAGLEEGDAENLGQFCYPFLPLKAEGLEEEDLLPGEVEPGLFPFLKEIDGPEKVE